MAEEVESGAASGTADSGSIHAKTAELLKGQLAEESQSHGVACGCHTMSRAIPRDSFGLRRQGRPEGYSLSHPETKGGERERERMQHCW